MSGDSAIGMPVPWAPIGGLVVLSLGASALPLTVVLLQRAIPAAGRILGLDAPELYMFGFGGVEGLHGGSRNLLGLVAVCYGLAVAAVAVSHLRRLDNRSSRTGAGLFIVAAALLLFAGPMLATAWAIAQRDRLIPGTPWGELVGNHGPWYRLYNLRLMVDGATLLPLAAPVPALLAFVVRPTLETLFRVSVFFGAGFLVFLLAMGCCYWLVD